MTIAFHWNPHSQALLSQILMAFGALHPWESLFTIVRRRRGGVLQMMKMVLVDCQRFRNTRNMHITTHCMKKGASGIMQTKEMSVYVPKYGHIQEFCIKECMQSCILPSTLLDKPSFLRSDLSPPHPTHLYIYIHIHSKVKMLM